MRRHGRRAKARWRDVELVVKRSMFKARVSGWANRDVRVKAIQDPFELAKAAAQRDIEEAFDCRRWYP